MLRQHHAIVFLSKDVTHILQNNQHSRSMANSRTLDLKKLNTRAADMVQASIERNLKSDVASCCLYPALTLSPQSVHRMAMECSKCGSNASSVENRNNVVSKKRIDNEQLDVRSLSGTYVKVEDVDGRYKLLFKELKEWPQIFYQSAKGVSPFDNPNVEHSLNDNPTKAKKRVKLCELCMTNYTDIVRRIKSLRHRDNATGEQNFVNLDRVIANGPSVSDLVQKKSN